MDLCWNSILRKVGGLGLHPIVLRESMMLGKKLKSSDTRGLKSRCSWYLTKFYKVKQVWGLQCFTTNPFTRECPFPSINVCFPLPFASHPPDTFFCFFKSGCFSFIAGELRVIPFLVSRAIFSHSFVIWLAGRYDKEFSFVFCTFFKLPWVSGFMLIFYFRRQPLFSIGLFFGWI